MSITVGPFTEGERPAPLVYTFQDADGNPIDLTGFTATFITNTHTGTATITDPDAGQVTHVWVDADLVEGSHRSNFWVGNGTNRYASDLIFWRARPAAGTPPNI